MVLDLHILAKSPIFLQLLHCALRAGQMCSNDEFGLSQKWQLLCDNFFCPSQLFFVSVLDECIHFVLRYMNCWRGVSGVFCLLTSCHRICGCNCLVRWFLVTVRSFNGLFMKLSQAFLSFIVAANWYVIISSAVILLNSHFLPISTSLFHYSSSIRCFLFNFEELGATVEYVFSRYKRFLEEFQ